MYWMSIVERCHCEVVSEYTEELYFMALHRMPRNKRDYWGPGDEGI
jgi:hypothetical protein